MRVLALAYKRVAPADAARGGWSERPREEAEEGLTFAGFIAFACKTRADSPTVIQAPHPRISGQPMQARDAAAFLC